MIRRFTSFGIAVATLTAALFGALPIHAQSAQQTYHIKFGATVASAPFACGRSYSGVGLDGVTIVPQTLRFYVSDIELLDAGGRATPLTLDQDGTWQRDDVAFISFDDNAKCSSGETASRTEAVGTAPALKYTAIRFTVGIPDALDHGDATIAASPLNVSEMFWSWTSGYKFLRFDTRVVAAGDQAAPDSYIFHLGSTGCSIVEKAVACKNPNRPVVTLDRFHPVSSVIVFDVAALLRTTPLAHSKGCMSNGDACAPTMGVLGLQPGTGQSVFSLR